MLFFSLLLPFPALRLDRLCSHQMGCISPRRCSAGLHVHCQSRCSDVCVPPTSRCVFAPTVDTDAPVNLRHSHEQWELLAWLLCLLSILLTPDLLLRPSANGQGTITLQNPYRAAVFKSKIEKKGFHR